MAHGATGEPADGTTGEAADDDRAELAAVDAAYRTLETARWNGAPRCPHCGDTSVRYLPAAAGRRLTRTGAATARRVWKCATCHRQFSALSETVLHGTRIDLRVWFSVIDQLASEGRVPIARRIAEEHRVSRDAALHVHRILARCCAVATVAACLPSSARTPDIEESVRPVEGPPASC